jgi:hypothetical protein
MSKPNETDDLDEVRGAWLLEVMMGGAGATGLGKLADDGFRTAGPIGNHSDISL